jgi:hypothetical protein
MAEIRINATETDGVTSRPLGEWPTDPNAE